MYFDSTKTELGARAVHLTGGESPSKPYSDFHRTLDAGFMALDVDYVEWRFKHGALIPVAVTEVTRIKLDKVVDEAYLNNILWRFEQKTIQARATRFIADRLGVSGFIVAFREDCSELWVYNLTTKMGWVKYDKQGYRDFLASL